MRPGADATGPLELVGELFVGGCLGVGCFVVACVFAFAFASRCFEVGVFPLLGVSFFGRSETPAGLDLACFCAGCAVFDLPGGGDEKSPAGGVFDARERVGSDGRG